ncbi:MAG: 1-acyl-sn-glycerol-3-phosphate acyltransferase [Lachnospiraceae bacterium]|nr:1-acyl-sn-glycerol-3-phosphate acyltransferase [Lachnospiraceae bacterium]
MKGGFSFRSFFCLFYLGLFLVFMLPAHVSYVLTRKKDPIRSYERANKAVRKAFAKVLFMAGTKMTVVGKENIPKDETVLFASNHQSYFDIISSHVAIGLPVGYVAKVEMDKFPLLRYYMRDIGCVFLDRKNPREGIKAIKEGAAHLEQGLDMFICPEGTRSQGDEMSTFKEGSLKMAEKAGVRVVPVAIVGTNRILECRPGFDIRKAKICIAFGEPFDPKSLPEEYKRRSAAYAEERVRELMAEHPLESL